jgi:hypothetical protein
MLKRTEEIVVTLNEGSSSFILNEASRLYEDLDESVCIVGENIEAVSLRGTKKEPILGVQRKRLPTVWGFTVALY